MHKSFKNRKTAELLRLPASLKSFLLSKSRVTGVLGAMLMLLACNTDVVSSPSLEHKPEALFVRLEMNHRAVLMSTVAPYDTVRLTTIPMGSGDVRWKPEGISDAQLDSLLRANPPRFISRDSTMIRVSEDGLVKVVRATTTTGTVQIIATQTIGPITSACTTLVRALPVEQPRTIKRLDIVTVDSLKVAANSSAPFRITGLDVDNLPIDNIVTYVRSSNVGMMLVGGAGWNKTTIVGGGRGFGNATISVSALVYGTPIRDSVVMSNGAPITNDSYIGGIAQNRGVGDIIIGPGGTVGWVNDTSPSGVDPDLDVIFDEPDVSLPALNPAQNTGGGNIIGIPGDRNLTLVQKTRYRRFLKPGVYTYRVSPRKLTGRIIVWKQ